MADILVYDIETTALAPAEGKIKRAGFWSYKYNKYVATSDPQKMVDYINDHDVLVGYNHIEFDNSWIEAHCGKIKYMQHVDMFQVIKKRAPNMKTKFKSFSMKNVCDTLGMGAKGNIDLTVLMAETNTTEEKVEIDKYLKQDVMLTKKLFEYMNNEFKALLEFLPKSEKAKYGHLLLSSGSYAYKAVCHMSGIEEKYDFNAEFKEQNYEGGFVALPTVESCKGKIYCLDFSSAYPHAFMMQNLYSVSNDIKNAFHENKLYTLAGYYNPKTMGKIEKTIQKLYALRQQYKAENDPREYAVKILINTIYGISGAPKFVNVYNINTASDCTLSVREWLKYARKVFIEKGYNVLYSDTDSIYLEDIFGDEEKMLSIKDEIITYIKASVPFPKNTFDMTVDDRIKGIWFFKDKNGKFKKKHYAYITEENKLKIKGIAIVKSNSSELAKLIVKKLSNQMLDSCDIKITRDVIDRMIKDEIEKDISIIQTEYKVHDASDYKSKTCIQMDILNKYGPGTHHLIRNKRIGAGKGVKYCTIDEAKNFSYNDLDLSRIWNELEPFIKTSQATLW